MMIRVLRSEIVLTKGAPCFAMMAVIAVTTLPIHMLTSLVLLKWGGKMTGCVKR